MSSSRSKEREIPGAPVTTGYRLLFEDSGLGMYMATASGRLLEVNAALARMCGYETPESFLASVDRLEKLVIGTRDGAVSDFKPEGRQQIGLRRKDGGEVLSWVHESIRDTAASDGACRSGVLEEITPRAEHGAACNVAGARESGDVSDREMEVIGRISHLASRSLDLEQVLDTILSETIDVVGADSGAIFLTAGGDKLKLLAYRNVSRTFIDRYSKDGMATGEGFGGQILQTLEPVYVAREAYADPRALEAGLELHSFIGVPLIARGEILGVIGVGTTSRRSLDQADVPLVETIGEQLGMLVRNAQIYGEHRHWATAIDQSSEIITITGTDGLMTYVNPAFEFVTGYSTEEAVGQSPGMLQSGQHDKSHYEDLWRTILGGEVWIGRFVNRKKDGTLWEAESTITPVKDEANAIVGFVEVKRDITEDLDIRERLRGAERMESVGRIAGGIAHDFNNLLAIINGYSDVLLSDLSPADSTRAVIEAIRKAGRRGAALTRQLLAFSKGQKAHLTELDLNQVVRDTESMLAETIGPDIDCQVRLDPELRPILADRVQLEQILPLAVNARDAMPKGGILKLETEAVVAASGKCSGADDRTILRVVDTGFGMSEDLAQRIFDPFFTTKSATGTGLGLAIVKEIAEQSRGQVTVDSRPGEGATFVVAFPAAKAVPNRLPDRDVPDTGSRGFETVLLVDDEEDVLNLARLVLERSGYQVQVAHGAAEAERILALERRKFSVMVTDVNMPGTSGIGLARRMTALYPDLALVFLSGQAEQLRSEDESERRYVLPKPFEPQDLTDILRRAIDGWGSGQWPVVSGQFRSEAAGPGCPGKQVS